VVILPLRPHLLTYAPLILFLLFILRLALRRDSIATTVVVLLAAGTDGSLAGKHWTNKPEPNLRRLERSSRGCVIGD
jgi:hypothetical protein